MFYRKDVFFFKLAGDSLMQFTNVPVLNCPATLIIVLFEPYNHLELNPFFKKTRFGFTKCERRLMILQQHWYEQNQYILVGEYYDCIFLLLDLQNHFIEIFE